MAALESKSTASDAYAIMIKMYAKACHDKRTFIQDSAIGKHYNKRGKVTGIVQGILKLGLSTRTENQWNIDEIYGRNL